METLYSIKDASVKLGGISPSTIVNWLADGKLSRTKVGRRTMIAESELQRFIREGGIVPLTYRKEKRGLLDQAVSVG